MFAWKLTCLFICVLFQMSSAERINDGHAMFFGIPISPRKPTGNPSPQVQTLVKSTYVASDESDPEDATLSHEVAIPRGNEPEPVISIEQDPKVGMESPGEDVISLFPNILQTEESAANAQRQPLNVATLASFIRTAMAITRPQRPPTVQSLFTRASRDPLRDMLTMAEIMIGRMGDSLAKQNPIDFIGLMDNVQNAVDRMIGDAECAATVDLMDQTKATLKELMETFNAVQKLGDMWNIVNISTLGTCMAKPGVVPASSEKAENVVSA